MRKKKPGRPARLIRSILKPKKESDARPVRNIFVLEDEDDVRPVRNIFVLEDEDDVRPVRNILTLDDEEPEEPDAPEEQQAGYLERYAEDEEGYVPIRPGRMYLTAEQIEEILQQRERQEQQKWKVSARAGSGSFGTVYDVEVIRLGIPSRYSLKVSDATGNMARELAYVSDEDYEKCREERERKHLERSRNEAALMRAFHDVPQIVNLEESWEMTRQDPEGVEHWLSFLLMDRWDGDLTDFTGKEMDQAAGLQLGADLMSALSEMKSRPLDGVSVAHRDMRCENVLYRSDKNVCGYRFALADFGIAKLDPPSGSRKNSIYGNIEDFLPPGEKYTWRSDVYLAGMAIYRFLSGWDWEQMERAFRPEVLRFDENGLITLDRPASIRNPQFWDLLKRMMQRDAKKRMEPAAALKEFERLRSEDASEKKSRFLFSAATFIAAVALLAVLLVWLLPPAGNGNEIVGRTRVEDLDGLEIPLETAGTKKDALEEIRQDMSLGNYDGALEKAEQYGLTETEEILNLQGILYAAGLGREVDLEQAIRYFEAACLQGQDSTGKDSDTQRAVSFRNLFLAALSADLEDMAEEGAEASVQMPHTAEALRFGELLGNQEAERILQERMFAVRGILPEAGENIFDSFWELENRPEILKDGIVEQEPYRYLVASDYDYIITQYENGEVGVEAVVVQIIERELPIRVMRGIYPDSYETFYGESIERAAENAVDIAVYDYPSTYIDENGNEQYWKDTEEFYYGEIPPEDTEDTRWMINGYDENGGRKFRKQIK